MSVKFYAKNLVKTATLTPSTVNAQFPVANIKSDFRTKVWRSTSNSDNLVIDLGSTEDVNAICLSDNWQSGFGITALTVEANDSDSWGAPAFSTTVTFDSTFGIGIKDLASTESYRFWRFVCTSTLGYCELANIYVGLSTDLVTNGIGYNWSYTSQDLARFGKTVFGQEYIDDYGQQTELDGMRIDVMNTTELGKFFEVYDNARSVNPFWINFGDGTDTVIDDEDRIKGIYKFKSEPKVTNTTSGFYGTSFSLREQK